MRAAPDIHVCVTRFGMWRAAVLAVGLFAVVAVVAWMTQHMRVLPWPAAAGQFAGGAVALVSTLWLTAGLVRMPAFQLRWDGLSWYFNRVDPTSTDAIAAEPQAGELSIAIDLGAWLLLRFTPGTPPGDARACWLPLQRQGLERQWHGLRCALYSPRPAPKSGAAAQR